MMEQQKTMVVCSRAFKHPVQRVFEAFLDPMTLAKWYGPSYTTVGILNVEPVVGGEYAIELRSERYGSMFTRGIYHEIERFKRLVFSFRFDPDVSLAGDSLVTVEFEEQNGHTLVTLRQVLEKVIDPAGRTQGWDDSLEKLAQILGG